MRSVRLAIAGSLGASVALGLQGHGRDGSVGRPLSTFASGLAYSLARPAMVSASMLTPPPHADHDGAAAASGNTARIIDGKAIAATVRREIKVCGRRRSTRGGAAPLVVFETHPAAAPRRAATAPSPSLLRRCPTSSRRRTA